MAMKKRSITTVFFVIGLVVMGLSHLTACSNSTPVEGDIRSVNSRGQVLNKKVQEKNEAELSEISQVLSAAQLGHRLFSDFWSIQFSEKAEVSSPFKALEMRLKKHLSDKGVLAEKFQRCPEYSSVAQLGVLAEQGQEKLTPTPGSSQNRPKVLRLLSSSDCAREPLEYARVTFFEDRMTILFQRHQMQDGFGLQMALKGGSATCDFQLNKDKKIVSLRCVGLGQSRSSAEFLELVVFEYIRPQQVFNVKGSLFNLNFEKTCQGEGSNPCIDLTCRSGEGKCKILETLPRFEETPTPTPAPAPSATQAPATPAAQEGATPVGTPGPAESSNSQTAPTESREGTTDSKGSSTDSTAVSEEGQQTSFPPSDQEQQAGAAADPASNEEAANSVPAQGTSQPGPDGVPEGEHQDLPAEVYNHEIPPVNPPVR